ncbi:MAG: hypothetical protein ABR923_12250 [Terracidiphilus sp.]|jgi:hypothetical protein
MEADWEVEVGGGAPVIDAAWAGLVDLRLDPGLAHELTEAAQFPALGRALATLNSSGSPVSTSKCDVWTLVDPADWSPDELNAPVKCAAHAVGCYIDLLPASGGQWNVPETASESCKRLCARLHSVPLRCCRADLVIRQANRGHVELELGITAYLTGCGATADEAAQVLGTALHAFADAVLAACVPAAASSKLQ